MLGHSVFPSLSESGLALGFAGGPLQPPCCTTRRAPHEDGGSSRSCGPLAWSCAHPRGSPAASCAPGVGGKTGTHPGK
eukprot:8917265-Alexandrium_andersonii.AAC.1